MRRFFTAVLLIATVLVLGQGLVFATSAPVSKNVKLSEPKKIQPKVSKKKISDQTPSYVESGSGPKPKKTGVFHRKYATREMIDAVFSTEATPVVAEYYKENRDGRQELYELVGVAVGAMCTNYIVNVNSGQLDCADFSCPTSGFRSFQATAPDGSTIYVDCYVDCDGVEPNSDGSCDCLADTDLCFNSESR